VLASSGIENDIKLWTPTQRNDPTRNLEEEYARIWQRNIDKVSDCRPLQCRLRIIDSIHWRQLRDGSRTQAMPLSMFRALLRTMGERRARLTNTNATTGGATGPTDAMQEDEDEGIQIAFGSASDEDEDEDDEGGPGVHCRTQ
jgi:hypothetical protein